VQVGSRATDRQDGTNKASPGYSIRALERSEFERWDEFVRQSPQGTLFHSTLWLEAAGDPFQLLGCFRGRELQGGCAVALFGQRVAGMPQPALTPYLGILFPKWQAKYVTEISNNKEIGIALATFLKNKFDWIELSLTPEVYDLQPFIWQGFDVELHYTYRLPLTDLDAVFQNMDARRRNKLVSAEKQGVTIEAGVDFSEIVRLTAKSFERQHLLATHTGAAQRFEAALRPAGRCRGFLARDHEGGPLGAVWITWDDKRAYYLLGGYDHSEKANKAVSLALWRAIQFTANDLKLREFDFEGSVIPAVEQFFRKFGATLTPFYTIRTRRLNFTQRVVRKLKRIVDRDDARS
jgi:Acetyltransferase (GNAT) domain